jgi:hypothetical protein
MMHSRSERVADEHRVGIRGKLSGSMRLPSWTVFVVALLSTSALPLSVAACGAFSGDTEAERTPDRDGAIVVPPADGDADSRDAVAPLADGGVASVGFVDLTWQPLSTEVTSNVVTVTSISGPVAVVGAGDAMAAVRLGDAGAWVTTGFLRPGETLQARVMTSSDFATTSTATINIGDAQTTWKVTTRPAALRIFQTSSTFVGSSIGSLAKADEFCQ